MSRTLTDMVFQPDSVQSNNVGTEKSIVSQPDSLVVRTDSAVKQKDTAKVATEQPVVTRQNPKVNVSRDSLLVLPEPRKEIVRKVKKPLVGQETAKIDTAETDTVMMAKQESPVLFKPLRFDYKKQNVNHLFVNEATSYGNTEVDISEKQIRSYDWMFIVIILAVGMLIAARRNYRKYFDLTLSSFSSHQFSYKLFLDTSQFYNQISLLLTANAMFAISMFFYQTAKYFNYQPFGADGLRLYFIILVFLLGLYIIQKVGIELLGLILERQSSLKEYNHHAFTLKKIFGIVILPLTIGIAYLPHVIKPYLIGIGFIVMVVIYFRKLFRGTKILLDNRVLKLQWILYFCTLEFIPVGIIIKLVKSLA